MQVIIASNNQDKLTEIQDIFDIPDWKFFTLKDLNILSDPEENGSSFSQNAKIKAVAAREIADKMGYGDYAVVADDSGLCVDALGGRPGVHSARYAADDGEHASYSDNNQKLLAELKDIAEEKRTAHFETAACYIDPKGNCVETIGICEGRIGFELVGQNGFGFDPLFLPKQFDYKITMAQLSADEKSAISHRGNAFRNLKEKLNC